MLVSRKSYCRTKCHITFICRYQKYFTNKIAFQSKTACKYFFALVTLTFHIWTWPIYCEGTKNEVSRSRDQGFQIIALKMRRHMAAYLSIFLQSLLTKFFYLYLCLQPLTLGQRGLLADHLSPVSSWKIFRSRNSSLLQGVLQARGILSDDFGCVHIHIGEPISIRQFANGRIDRVLHALEPRYPT